MGIIRNYNLGLLQLVGAPLGVTILSAPDKWTVCARAVVGEDPGASVPGGGGQLRADREPTLAACACSRG